MFKDNPTVCDFHVKSPSNAAKRLIRNQKTVNKISRYSASVEPELLSIFFRSNNQNCLHRFLDFTNRNQILLSLSRSSILFSSSSIVVCSLAKDCSIISLQQNRLSETVNHNDMLTISNIAVFQNQIQYNPSVCLLSANKKIAEWE